MYWRCHKLGQCVPLHTDAAGYMKKAKKQYKKDVLQMVSCWIPCVPLTPYCDYMQLLPTPVPTSVPTASYLQHQTGNKYSRSLTTNFTDKELQKEWRGFPM